MSGGRPRLIDVVLAAGAGRRMGITKGLLEVGGRPALARVLDAVLASSLDGAVVVLGADADRVMPLARRPKVGVVVNPRWEAGQTASLKAGLAALPAGTDGFLIHPVDHVFAEAADLDALAAAFAAAPDPMAILRPACGEALGHPVLFGIGYLPEFRALEDDHPARAVYRRHRDCVCLVPVSNPLIARDLDRPEDLGQ